MKLSFRLLKLPLCIATCMCSFSIYAKTYVDFTYDDLFSPLEIETYVDAPTESQKKLSVYANISLDVFYAGLYGFKVLEQEDFHKKMLVRKTILSSKVPQHLAQANINDVLDELDNRGIRHNTRVQIIVESRIHNKTTIVLPADATRGMGPIQKTIIDQQVNQNILNGKNHKQLLRSLKRGIPIVSEGSLTKKLLVKDITRDQLTRVLDQMNISRVGVYKVEVGKVRTSGAKVFGSVIAIYLTLDLINSLDTGF